MRIAVFYNLFFSGAKRTVFEHVKGLKKLGHTIDVYTIDEDSDLFSPGKISDNEYIYLYKKRIVNFPLFKKVTSDFNDFFSLKLIHKKIAKDIDERNYAVVLVHTDHITQAPFILRFLKTKNVYFCLEPLKIGYEYGLRTSSKLPVVNRVYEKLNLYMRKKIDRENARFADRTIAISNFGRELMIQAFDLYPQVSYLGVDSELFRNSNLLKKNQILFLGQKLNMNGYNYAIQAIKYVPEKIRPKLKVISISKNEKKLLDQEIVKLYNESLLTLSLSTYDTFGLVPLESMACEVPVIAFNVAGYRETIINKKTGYLVDFSAKEIAEKITLLIRNPLLRKKMGKEGRKNIKKKWEWKLQNKKLEKLLTKNSE